MQKKISAAYGLLFLLSIFLAHAALGGTRAPSTERVLYSFAGGSDGASPQAGVIMDASGNLYGTTASGGASVAGTVFKLSPDGSEIVLYSFRGRSDGYLPRANLILDGKGNLYGTTECGGASSAGTVFKIAPDGTETLLYSFTGGSDGGYPYAELLSDRRGNLYSTTKLGGASDEGVVFKLTSRGQLTVLHSFTGAEDGARPFGGLVMDEEGNLFGTTNLGGIENCGTIFKVTPDGTESVIHSFGVLSTDGRSPVASLIRDKAGNLYGTTTKGGTRGHGAVFEVTPEGTESVLYSFSKGDNGIFPAAALTMDRQGNLYGTTVYGGPEGVGVVFKVAQDGTETVLHSFGANGDGVYPLASLIRDEADNLYGTTELGGANGDGIVFEIQN